MNIDDLLERAIRAKEAVEENIVNRAEKGEKIPRVASDSVIRF